MQLVEQTPVPSAALPVAQFKDHLLLGSGFADDGSQDTVIEEYLRAAIAAIEARTGKILIEKNFTWTLTNWREACRQPLPLAPIASITEVRIIDRQGQATIIDPQLYRLERDDQRPALWSNGGLLPTIADGGSAEIDFPAGYGAAWTAVPSDLAQASFLLAARFYEDRSAGGGLPAGVTALIEPYRNVRLFGGGTR